MQTKEIGDRLRRATAEAAFGGDAEIGRHLFGGGRATPRAFDPVRQVYEAQIKFGAVMKPDFPQRREVGVIVPVAWHRHVNPGHRPPKLLGEPVMDFHHAGRIGRLADVFVAGVAVAKMHAELDVGRDVIADPGE